MASFKETASVIGGLMNALGLELADKGLTSADYLNAAVPLYLGLRGTPSVPQPAQPAVKAEPAQPKPEPTHTAAETVALLNDAEATKRRMATERAVEPKTEMQELMSNVEIAAEPPF
jgi:hypothetical protein